MYYDSTNQLICAFISPGIIMCNETEHVVHGSSINTVLLMSFSRGPVTILLSKVLPLCFFIV